MRRKRIWVAALAAGGMWLGAGEAQACAGHEEAVKSSPQAEAKSTDAREAPKVQVAARCKCSSAADCTCKKGECECTRCRKHSRDVVEPLQGEAPRPAPRQVRYDASAGHLT